MSRESKYFKSQKQLMKLFPQKGSYVVLEDFFQDSVDSFHDGHFIFKSVKAIKLRTSEKLLKLITEIDKIGYLVTMQDEYGKHKILVGNWQYKPWANNYHTRSEIANIHGCDLYAIHESIENFASWLSVKKIYK